jgi:hypothetical protein
MPYVIHLAVNKIIIVLVFVVTLSMITIATERAEAAPNFSKADILAAGGEPTGKLIGVVKVVDSNTGRSSDCWNEHYLRATPKNNNHVLLNKETIKNNDKPDAGSGEMHSFSWYYDVKKMQATTTTNEGKVRLYDAIELVDGTTGETVTKYISRVAGKITIDFGIFTVHVDGRMCQ